MSVNAQTKIQAPVCLTPKSVFLKTMLCASQIQGWMTVTEGFPEEVISAERGSLIQSQPREERGTSDVL